MGGQGVFGERMLAKNTRLPRFIEMIQKFIEYLISNFAD